MAIEQTRYIDIKSGVANANVPERNLQGLVFANDEMIGGAAHKSDYDDGKVVKLTSADIVAEFGPTSQVGKFAEKYFAYIAPDGSCPTTLSVSKVLAGDSTPLASFQRVDSQTNDFGSFTFLTTTTTTGDNPVVSTMTPTIAQLKAVAQENASKNYKYLFVVGVSTVDSRLGDIDNSTAGLQNIFTELSGISGTHLCIGMDEYIAAIPMAITASVDYNKLGATVNMMFKQVGGEIAAVSDGTTADEYDALNVNYYGITQTNGTQLAFYQRGFNADGLDTMVYFNEIWLKSQIATAFLNLATSVNKIPADNAGISMVRSVVMDAVNQAFNNGIITLKNSLTPSQRANILQLSGGDENSPTDVLTNGYWLDVVIQTVGSSTTEYKAVYTLIYSKNDAIRFVQGYHELI